MRSVPLDGALLLFDRDEGWNVRIEDERTRGLRMRAPRAIQFAITNRCNLACGFCSRDASSESTWTVETALELLGALAREGVLEVAFGGGEPFAFRGIEELIVRLHQETPLAVSLTTNGMLLDRARLRAIAGRYGQIRVSLYEDPDARPTIAMLAEERARFGVNWLLTPARLAGLDRTVLELAALGCRDVLVLAYKGPDAGLHLDRAQVDDAAQHIARLSRALAGRMQLGLDVCWGSRMSAVPQILRGEDCGAGRDFLVITSDRRVSPCSFHHRSWPIASAEDVLAVWRRERDGLAERARVDGCPRPTRSLPIVQEAP